jgi:AcrR family transcriptional regulator
VARSIPADRLPAVLAAAAGVFITHGYRRAQVQDVADALGLAKGTLYGYAAGKEALFAAAVRYADGAEPLPAVADLPLAAPAPGELAALVAARLAAQVTDMALTRALAQPDPPAGSGGQASWELAGIVVDLYRRLAAHRVAIKLVDRCAAELPELAEVWFGSGRGAQLAGMEAYLRRREATGTLVLPGPPPLVARTVVELCVLWAVHCWFDPAPPDHAHPDAVAGADDEAVAATLAGLLAHGLLPPAEPRSRPHRTR